MRPSTFNLIDEPWIRVRRLDSAMPLVSIREALATATEIKAVAGEIPTQDVAILRLLLAILLGSIRPDHERTEQETIDLWEAWWEAGTFPDVVLDYLTAVHSRFDLLDAAAPFYQVAGLTTASGRASGLGKLIAEVPDGEPYFTTRTREEVASLSLAEAARWLVHCMAFDPSGIKSGAVGDDRVKGGKGYPLATRLGPATSGWWWPRDTPSSRRCSSTFPWPPAGRRIYRCGIGRLSARAWTRRIPSHTGRRTCSHGRRVASGCSPTVRG